MKILAIETSADETAIAVLESASSGYHILGDIVFSQARMHSEYGGIYPSLAKREHQKNLVPLTTQVLTTSNLLKKESKKINESDVATVRDEKFRNDVKEFLETHAKPDIDLIAVTHAPGLEIALWNGITFAQSLSAAWKIPVVGINHLEGHIVSALVERNGNELHFTEPQFPILSLLISGGHTELVLMKDWFEYELIGKTRDDAVGEAFDKVARLLSLPYPGGPEIDQQAAIARERGIKHDIALPRPMLNDNSCDFSFSGLKTAVLYLIRDMKGLSKEDVQNISMEFEDAVRDVLVEKTKRALEKTGAKTLVVGGGVSANKHIHKGLENLLNNEHPEIDLHYPGEGLTGDNAIMIGIAAGMRHAHKKLAHTTDALVARGSLSLAE